MLTLYINCGNWDLIIIDDLFYNAILFVRNNNNIYYIILYVTITQIDSERGWIMLSGGSYT